MRSAQPFGIFFEHWIRAVETSRQPLPADAPVERAPNRHRSSIFGETGGHAEREQEPMAQGIQFKARVTCLALVMLVLSNMRKYVTVEPSCDSNPHHN